MKAYEEFLRDAGRPIGWLVVICVVLFGGFTFVRWIFSTTPEHQEFAEVCTLRGGTVEKIAGNHFCAKVTAHPTILEPDLSRYKSQCREAGGVPKSRHMIGACYMFEIMPELGKRNDYTVGEK